MLFNSFAYLFFLPLVLALFFAFRSRHRWIFLLGASYYFYMSWRVEYIALILLSTLVDYVSALRIEEAKALRSKRLWLGLSLAINLGMLLTFKYLDFGLGSVNDLTAWLGSPIHLPTFDLLLPVGISFYTFQTLSYTIDVYFGKMKAERHLGYFALYVSFFPQLVAGPIERPQRLLPQLRADHSFSWARLSDGFKQLLWGLFKKVVVADRVAQLVDTVYAQPADFPGFPLIIATFFFAIQIYCDFSGYTDMAIGSARMMGIDLMQNFRAPYWSKSISEFWGRWHISLSTWFRDYVYIPMGGNKVSRWRWYLNLFVVFVVSGLWHGANWTFVVWGAIHGVFLMAQRFAEAQNWIRSGAAYSGFKGLLSWGITFSIVMLAWIFFRANSVGEAVFILAHLLDSPGYVLSLGQDFVQERSFLYRLGLNQWEFFIALCSIVFLLGMDAWSRDGQIHELMNRQKTWLRIGFYVFVTIFIVMFGYFVSREFIYFQF